MELLIAVEGVSALHDGSIFVGTRGGMRLVSTAELGHSFVWVEPCLNCQGYVVSNYVGGNYGIRMSLVPECVRVKRPVDTWAGKKNTEHPIDPQPNW